MASRQPDIRTAFQSRKKNALLSVLFLLVSLVLIVLAPVWWINANYAIDYVFGVVFALVGLFGLLVSLAGIIAWHRPLWLIFTTEGIAYGRAESPLRLPWSAIGSMHITDRWPNGTKMPWRRLPDASGLRVRWLVAYPTSDVTNPRDGRWNGLWNTDRWQLCAVHTMDGEEEDLAAAITATAPPTIPLRIDSVEVRLG